MHWGYTKEDKNRHNGTKNLAITAYCNAAMSPEVTRRDQSRTTQTRPNQVKKMEKNAFNVNFFAVINFKICFS